MAERELVRAKEPEAKAVDFYQSIYQFNVRQRARSNEGKAVIKASERPWETASQACALPLASLCFGRVDKYRESGCFACWL